MVHIVQTSFITKDTWNTYLVHLVPAFQTERFAAFLERMLIVNLISLGYGLLIGQKKTFVDVILRSD